MSVTSIAKKTLSGTGKVVEKTGDIAGTFAGDGGKSLFFLIMACLCAWLILDIFYGADLIGQLVNKLFGVSSGSETTDTSSIKNASNEIAENNKDNQAVQKVNDKIQNSSDKEILDDARGSIWR